jgi:hypothetical protein
MSHSMPSRCSHIVLSGILILLLILPAAATAAGPHFAGVKPSIDSDGDLVVSFKEGGLDPGEQGVGFYLQAVCAPIFVCPDGTGGCGHTNQPWDVATFTAGERGTITGSPELSCDLTPPPSLECGCSGETLVLSSITWSDIILQETAHNLERKISRELTRVF